MFNGIAARALLGAAALGSLGATTAVAAAPAEISPKPAATAPRAATDVRHGVVIKLSDTQMTVERTITDKTTKAVTRDDVSFEIDASTHVYRAGSKDPVGHDALKLGERVRVRFAESKGQRVARRVVIERDLRAGKVVSRGNDFFVVHTARLGDVKVVVTDKTRFTIGRKRDGKDGSFSDLKVGDRALVVGEEDSAHNFDAVAVRYNTPKPHRSTTPSAR